MAIENKNADWVKKTALFLTGQTISLFGSSLVQFAIIWYITLETKSGVMITISTICSTIPQIIISLFAGVWADRYSRKTLIIISDSIIAFATLIVAVFFILGYDNFYLLMVIAAIRSMGSGVYQPAVGALIPQIVPEDKLMRVNGINTTIQSLIFLMAPMASALLYSMAKLNYIFFVDVVTAVIGISLLSFIKVPLHKKAMEKQESGHFEDFKAGIAYINSDRLIKSLFIFFAVMMLFIVPFAYFTPLLVARSYGEEVWRLTANEVTFFVGSTLGGAVISLWGGFKNKIHTLVAAAVGFGVFGGALGLCTNFYVYLVIMALTGALMPFFNTATMVIFQERIEPDMQGRIFSFFSIVVSSAMPLGMLIFGPLADIVKIEYVLIGSGIVLIIIGIFMALDKNLRLYGLPPEGNSENYPELSKSAEEPQQ